MQGFSHMPPSVQAENRLPIGDGSGDGNPQLLCLRTSAIKVIRTLFAPIHSLHPETFDALVAAAEALATTRKGKSVVDVDAVVALTLEHWTAGREGMREAAAALFAAADVNNDGHLSYDEFTQLVLLIHPAASEGRIYTAFRECIDLSAEGRATDAYVEAEMPMQAGLAAGQGISAGIFVTVIEVHGLLGVTLSSEASKHAAQALLDDGKKPSRPSSRESAKGGGGAGASSLAPQQPALTRNESHKGLRRDLLICEWQEAEGQTRDALATMRAQLAALQSGLSALPKGTLQAGCVQERATLLAELEEVDAALQRLHKMLPHEMPADTKGDPRATEAALDEASVKRAWETYRNLHLKLKRVVARVAELEQNVAGGSLAKVQARAAPAAAPMKAKRSAAPAAAR